MNSSFPTSQLGRLLGNDVIVLYDCIVIPVTVCICTDYVFYCIDYYWDLINIVYDYCLCMFYCHYFVLSKSKFIISKIRLKLLPLQKLA